jgi:RNA polymerase sigma-70 factor (ECF subfamily)
MAEAADFAELFRRVRAGDADAAEALVREYEPEIRREVRLRLTDPKLRRVLDSMDVCQSVLGNFFVRATLGQFDLESPQQLLGLLTTMARHKVIDHQRRQRVRAVGERALSALTPGSDGREPAHPGPSPSSAVARSELLAEVRRRMTAEERQLPRPAAKASRGKRSPRGTATALKRCASDWPGHATGWWRSWGWASEWQGRRGKVRIQPGRPPQPAR